MFGNCSGFSLEFFLCQDMLRVNSMPISHRDPDSLDLDEDVSSEELTAQVQRAQAELGELKRRSEQIERDKQRLEELSRRQDELEAGRGEMIDRFTRSLATIQRETEETQRRLEQLHAIHNSFLAHTRELEAINPKLWHGSDLSKELSRAMSLLDDARADYSKSQAKLEVEAPEAASMGATGDYEEYYGSSEKGFSYWLTAGFAFTLPLIAVLLLIAVVFWMAGGTGN